MSDDIAQATGTDSCAALNAEAAEQERQFRELLEFCPAALLVVDEDGRLLFHNARLREMLGYAGAGRCASRARPCRSTEPANRHDYAGAQATAWPLACVKAPAARPLQRARKPAKTF